MWTYLAWKKPCFCRYLQYRLVRNTHFHSILLNWLCFLPQFLKSCIDKKSQRKVRLNVWLLYACNSEDITKTIRTCTYYLHCDCPLWLVKTSGWPQYSWVPTYVRISTGSRDHLTPLCITNVKIRVTHLCNRQQSTSLEVYKSVSPFINSRFEKSSSNHIAIVAGTK